MLLGARRNRKQKTKKTTPRLAGAEFKPSPRIREGSFFAPISFTNRAYAKVVAENENDADSRYATA